MKGVRWVLVPSVMNYPVLDEVKRTFEDEKEVKLVPLVMTIITNYTDKEQVGSVREEIENGIKLLKERLSEEDEVYLVVGGSCLGVAFAVESLMREGINFTKLVFEKKIDRYAVVEE